MAETQAERERVQEIFGQAVLEAIRTFAHRDIEPIERLEEEPFGHVSSETLRRAMATTLFGTRWLYKVCLAVRASQAERLAVLRMQIIDYAAISEALLKDAVSDGVDGGVLVGQEYQYRGKKVSKNKIRWNKNALITLNTSSINFRWLNAVAREEKIVTDKLYGALEKLRNARNTVHIGAEETMYTPDMVKHGLDTMHKTAKATRTWKRRKKIPVLDPSAQR